MNSLYEETILTPKGVARATGFLDWSSQPSIFKRYPDFLFRYAYGSAEELHLIELARMVSSTTQIASKPYLKLTPPSAGNLHPVELYVQIRGVKGILSGIYHVDASRAEIVLIQEIQKDGLEPYVGIKGSLYGVLFVVSVVPFRAQWKYGHRALRYCYLDAGHQMGAIAASMKLYDKKITILSGFDKAALHETMGFKDEEYIASVAYSGEIRESSVALLKQNLIHVAPTDYSELKSSLIKTVEKNELLQMQELELKTEVSEQSIMQRRSARQFESDIPMDSQHIEEFLHFMDSPKYPLASYVIALGEAEGRAGVYHKGVCIQKGVFAKEIVTLTVEQKFLENASFIYVITSKYFSANTLMQAAIEMHDLYLHAQIKGFGCSGIGAFYDKMVQNFLGTQEYILYIGALGVKR